jgi:hypothetical protein
MEPFNKQWMMNPEEPISRARFDDTGDEEKEENMDNLIDDEYNGEDMPTIEWDMEDPKLTPCTIFARCRNVVMRLLHITFSLKMIF